MISFAARVRVAHADEPLDIAIVEGDNPAGRQMDDGGGPGQALGPPWMEVPRLHRFEG